jgi:hypothetical protein
MRNYFETVNTDNWPLMYYNEDNDAVYYDRQEFV